MNVGQSAHLSGQMSGQGAQMNQVVGSGSGVVGADGMPLPQHQLQHQHQHQHQQMQDGVGLVGTGIDPQFVMLRNSMREKIFEYIGRKQTSADWKRRLPELARRLEEILFRKFPSKTEYYNMMKSPVEPELQFAIKTLSTQNQQNQLNQQMSRQMASSSGYGTTIPTPGIIQGASGNSRMSYGTDNMGLSSSGAGMVPQNANMGTSMLVQGHTIQKNSSMRQSAKKIFIETHTKKRKHTEEVVPQLSDLQIIEEKTSPLTILSTMGISSQNLSSQQFIRELEGKITTQGLDAETANQTFKQDMNILIAAQKQEIEELKRKQQQEIETIKEHWMLLRKHNNRWR